MFGRLAFWILFLGVIGSGIWYFEGVRIPCRTPLHYSLGQFDPQFGISQADFLAAISDARELWEKRLGRWLFTYDPEASFHINLIFDERQARTQAQQKLESTLSTNTKERNQITASYSSVYDQYQKAKHTYETDSVNFEKQLSAYNSDVAAWNANDRTDTDELHQLQQEESRLKKQSQRLEQERQTVNALVPQVNALVRSGQQKVNEYNAQVANFTDRYGSGGEFDQGLYTGTEINIYQFDDPNHLRAVLVHELGHALGLSHVTNPLSIMYPVLKDQKLDHLVLSTEDVAALQVQCERTTSDQIKQDFQAWLVFWKDYWNGSKTEVVPAG